MGVRALHMHHKVTENLREYVGSVGVNAGMRAVMASAKICFGWRTLYREAPKARPHAAAYVDLVEKLRPALLQSRIPAGPEWSFVNGVDAYRQKRGPNGIVSQYQSLTRRVRAYARRCRERGPWFQITEYVVLPVATCGVLEASLALLEPFGSLLGVSRQCVLDVIARFVGLYPHLGPHTAFLQLLQRPFRVRRDALARVGCGRVLLGGNLALRPGRIFRGDIGSFASVGSQPFKGKVVRIVGTNVTLDEDAVLASLESDPCFTAPDSEGLHCWHAVRLCHRVRMMRCRDATCERWGSLLHHLFDPNPTRPHRYAARLFIREGNLGGPTNEAQEAILSEMTTFLHDEERKNPVCKRGSKRKRVADAGGTLGEMELRELRQGLRRSTALALDPEEACPTKLKPAVEQKLRALSTRARNLNRGSIGVLPTFQEDHRTMAKDRAGSTLRDALQTWLESEDARNWREERRALFAPERGDLGLGELQ